MSYLIVAIIIQALLYAATAYIFYRFVYKTAIVNRAASLTEKPDETDYVPEAVDKAFITRISGNRERALNTQHEYDLAAIFENWNPGEMVLMSPHAYDAVIPAVTTLFKNEPEPQVLTNQLTRLLQDTYQVEPKNVPGMVNYLINWFRVNQ